MLLSFCMGRGDLCQQIAGQLYLLLLLLRKGWLS